MFLKIHGFSVGIDCPYAEASAAIAENFGHMASSHEFSHLCVRVRQSEDRAGFVVLREGHEPLLAENYSDLIYELEGIITVELQMFRRDLLFLHAAVLERDGHAVLLVADSGGGKSTTAWALLHHGFAYLSDELAVIELESQAVCGYPHAVCLKRVPPMPYGLPKESLNLGRTLHVPVRHLPTRVTWGPFPLGAVFFVNFVAAEAAPSLLPISAAAASARLYANVLNALAHSGAGLDATINLVKNKACFILNTGKLADTCALVVKTLEALGNSR